MDANVYKLICKYLQTYLQISTNLSANICKYLQMADRQNVIKGKHHSPKAVHSLSESCTIHYYFVTYYFDLWISEINTVCTNLSQSLIHAIGILTHAGGAGSNPGQAELWRFVTFKPLKLQQCTLHFRKPLIFFCFDKKDQDHSCMFSLWYTFFYTHRFTS